MHLFLLFLRPHLTEPPTTTSTTNTQHQIYIGPWQDYLMLRRHRLAGSDESPQLIFQPPAYVAHCPAPSPPQIRRPPPACPPHKDHAAPIDTLPISTPSEEQPAKTFVFAEAIFKNKNRRTAHGGKRTLSSSTATPARQRLDTAAKMRRAWSNSVEIEGAK